MVVVGANDLSCFVIMTSQFNKFSKYLLQGTVLDIQVHTNIKPNMTLNIRC